MKLNQKARSLALATLLALAGLCTLGAHAFAQQPPVTPPITHPIEIDCQLANPDGSAAFSPPGTTLSFVDPNGNTQALYCDGKTGKWEQLPPFKVTPFTPQQSQP